jgi:hypothetical protein
MVERQETLPMRRRRLLLGAGAVVLLGVAGFSLFLWLTTPTPGATWENFHRLRKGMSLSDVKALLGEPDEMLPIFTSKHWETNDIVIILSFDTDQRLLQGLAHTAYQRGPIKNIPDEVSFLDRIRRWLHL